MATAIRIEQATAVVCAGLGAVAVAWPAWLNPPHAVDSYLPGLLLFAAGALCATWRDVRIPALVAATSALAVSVVSYTILLPRLGSSGSTDAALRATVEQHGAVAVGVVDFGTSLVLALFVFALGVAARAGVTRLRRAEQQPPAPSGST